jgi:CHAD domain-containing protein/CYTH domain-containing protein
VIQIDRKLLARSPEETARQLCLRLLEEADVALGRLERSEDEDALHDFRVALRRVRSLARAYKPYLKGSVGKKRRSRLRELASLTGAARDAEVQIAWLRNEAPALDSDAREAAEHVGERLASEASETPSPEVLRKEFDSIRASLEESLARIRLRLDSGETSFLSATGTLLREAGVALAESLASVVSPASLDELHGSRIRAKRLRYVLEPLQGVLEDAKSLVKRTKELQDVLGEIQDARVLADTVSRELERVALEEAQRLRDLTLREGGSAETSEASLAVSQHALLALLRVQRERKSRGYEELARDWLGGASEPFFRDLTELADRLRSTGAPATPRRFLLESLPEQVRRRTPRVVREGFLPGKRIRERVQSVRTGRSTRYRRIVEVEGGLPLEENISRADFEKLWRMSDGRRLERLRYPVRDGDRLWLIDSLPAHGLAFAETAGNDDLPVPEWLEPLVVEEVTSSKKYAAEKLARRKPRIHRKMD